jgi:hypothetical protein
VRTFHFESLALNVTSLNFRCGNPDATNDGETPPETVAWMVKNPFTGLFEDWMDFAAAHMLRTECCADSSNEATWPKTASGDHVGVRSSTVPRKTLNKPVDGVYAGDQAGCPTDYKFAPTKKNLVCINQKIVAEPECVAEQSAETSDNLPPPPPAQIPMSGCTDNPKAYASTIAAGGRSAMGKKLDAQFGENGNKPEFEVVVSEPKLNVCKSCPASSSGRRLQDDTPLAEAVFTSVYMTFVPVASQDVDATKASQTKAFEANNILGEIMSEPTFVALIAEEMIKNIAAEKAAASPEDQASFDGIIAAPDLTALVAEIKADLPAGGVAAIVQANKQAFEEFVNSPDNVVGATVEVPGVPQVKIPEADLDDGLGAGAIVGIVCGGLVGIALLVFAIMKCSAKKE